MAVWYLERQGASSTRVILPALSQDWTPVEEQRSDEQQFLDGSSSLWKAPPSPVSPEIPLLHFTDEVELGRLKKLCQGVGPLTLCTDGGYLYTVAHVGDWRPVALAKATQSSPQRWEIKLNLRGVHV